MASVTAAVSHLFARAVGERRPATLSAVSVTLVAGSLTSPYSNLMIEPQGSVGSLIRLTREGSQSWIPVASPGPALRPRARRNELCRVDPRQRRTKIAADQAGRYLCRRRGGLRSTRS